MKALLIGCGAMGLRHALTLKNMGIEIAGVVDISSDALQAGIDKGLYNSSAAFTDPDKAFSEAEVDLVVISTTAPLHHEYLRRAAERGVKYVLCEKPLAPSLGQCEDMLRICSEHSIRCAVNHQRRCTPSAPMGQVAL